MSSVPGRRPLRLERLTRIFRDQGGLAEAAEAGGCAGDVAVWMDRSAEVARVGAGFGPGGAVQVQHGAPAAAGQASGGAGQA